MRVVLIGRGRLATNLQAALQQAGHAVTSINSRTLEGLPQVADVFIISVSDKALRDVVVHATAGREDQLFMHTAGSMPLSIFDGTTRYGGVFYPMQTFSKERIVDFSEVPVFLETTDAASLSVARQLAESITRQVYELSSESRRYLHLSAVFACNFVNHCYALSAEVLARQGIPFDVMLPLIDETARKVHELHPVAAQTGPAVRFDENVIRMQSAMLSGTAKKVYDLLSLSIHETAEKHD